MINETKKLAIEQLERISKNLGTIGETVDYTELAIEALEQEECEDAISRQAVLKQLKGCLTGGETEYKYVKIHIDSIPSVKPQEQKIGHWVKYCRPRCGEQHYKCTSCGYYINFGQWGELYTKEFKYCPNCGSKMEGEIE